MYLSNTFHCTKKCSNIDLRDGLCVAFCSHLYVASISLFQPFSWVLKGDHLHFLRSEFVKYRREKVLNVVDQRTGKKMSAKDIEDFQAAEDKKEKDIIQVSYTSLVGLN